ncbi:MAG: hypothetical protein ACK4N5_21550 [Myxococcales bacterium]
MKGRAFEGIFIALVPQRASALLELLREAAGQFLGERDQRQWSLEYGALKSPSGTVAFRLSHSTEPFPWGNSGYLELARLVSKLGPGKVWALVSRPPGKGERDGWAEAVVYDGGERTEHFEATGPDARGELHAWAGEELALSENELLALYESCEQTASVEEGTGRFEDEVDQALDRARREYQRYQELKRAREKNKP